MTRQAAARRLPPLPGLIAGGLVVLGVVLWMVVDKGLIFVAGLGAFGPGILRELGWLTDQDEFQRQAAHRAGYHAYLIGGLVTVLVVSGLEWGNVELEGSAQWLWLILIALWMSWLFSALLRYWGARKTASRVLLIFGSFWAVFVIGEVITELVSHHTAALFLGLLMACLVVGPFYVAAWTAGRWPRLTGAALLVVSVVFVAVFLWPRGSLSAAVRLLTAALLLIPLVASAIALLRERGPDDSASEATDEQESALDVAG